MYTVVHVGVLLFMLQLPILPRAYHHNCQLTLAICLELLTNRIEGEVSW